MLMYFRYVLFSSFDSLEQVQFFNIILVKMNSDDRKSGEHRYQQRVLNDL
jgi:hypothetical protein